MTGIRTINRRIKRNWARLSEERKRRARSFIGWAIGFSVVTTGGLLAIRTWHPIVGTIEENMTIWEVFFTVLGLTYAILVGLFLVEVHRRWSDLTSTIQREINAIADIADLLRYFDKDSANQAPKEVIKTLLGYVNEEILSDWWNTEAHHTGYWHGHRESVNAIMDAVEDLKPNDANDYCALEAIIGKICEMTSCRIDRIDAVRRRLHTTFYIFLFFMSAVLVTGFCLLDVQGVWLHWSMVFVVTVALYTLFSLIRDVDHPVSGFWNIREEAQRGAEDIIKRLKG